MLKMTIDNEEVLSNNDISIKEEILSPSSTILNNVYPKSWELDKDYTSRFYYPKDYSKLNIQNFSIEPEEAGKTIQVNGSATLTDVDTSKESRVLRLLGQTSQTGTPTPSSPIPINVVSGDNTIEIVGKNLLPQNKYIATQTKNGVTFTNNGDGTFNLVGTATANTTLVIIPAGEIELEANQPYYLYSSVQYDLTTFNMAVSFTENGTSKFVRANYTYTPTTTPTNERLQFYIASGQSINQTNIKLMLVKGNTAPTTYEPYIGNSYPIYLGVENYLPITLPSTTTQNGITLKYDSNTGWLTISGTATSNTNIVWQFPEVQLPSKTYIQYENNFATANAQIGFMNGSTTYSSLTFSELNRIYDRSANLGNKTINQCYFYIASGTTINGKCRPMITQYSTIQKYNPYGTTPIELCKIGTYQDYIYKENGSWYLHKEIGKVVINGTENYTFEVTPNFNQNRGRFTIYNFDTDYNSAASPISSVCNLASMTPDANNYPLYDQTFILRYVAGQKSRIDLMSSTLSATTSATFKTWLASNNLIVYYVLATPTTTEITDTLLLSQLNALESQ